MVKIVVSASRRARWTSVASAKSIGKSMPACNPCPHFGPGVLCQVRTTLDRPGTFHDGFTHALLPLLLSLGLAAGVPEPALHDLLKEIRNALLLRPVSLLQLAFEMVGEAPPIDLGLHAPQCSASGGLVALAGSGRGTQPDAIGGPFSDGRLESFTAPPRPVCCRLHGVLPMGLEPAAAAGGNSLEDSRDDARSLRSMVSPLRSMARPLHWEVRRLRSMAERSEERRVGTG